MIKQKKIKTLTRYKVLKQFESKRVLKSMTDKNTPTNGKKSEICTTCSTELDSVVILKEGLLIFNPKISRIRYCTTCKILAPSGNIPVLINNDSTTKKYRNFFDKAFQNAPTVKEKVGECPNCDNKLGLVSIIKKGKRTHIGQYCTECEFFTTYVPDNMKLSR